MSVAADRRRAGVGTAVLAALFDAARARGRTTVLVRTEPHWAGALAFYRRHGFEPFDADDVDVYLRRAFA